MRITLREMTVSAMFAAVVAVLSQVSIPVPVSPVPITGQMFGVFLAGGILGAKTGSLAMIIYVLLGAFGLPVFAGARGGASVLAGPSGGYIWGFIIGTYVLGRIVEHGTKGAASYIRVALGMCACLSIVYVLGTLQLAIVLAVDPAKALAIGVIPFILLDIAKLLGATLISVEVRRALASARLIRRTPVR